jgi:hypothetical protein
VTRELAIAAAELEAGKAPGRRFAVYRFPAWRDGVFGVRDAEQLPPQAETFEMFGDQPQRQLLDARAHLGDGESAAREATQGSLF